MANEQHARFEEQLELQQAAHTRAIASFETRQGALEQQNEQLKQQVDTLAKQGMPGRTAMFPIPYQQHPESWTRELTATPRAPDQC